MFGAPIGARIGRGPRRRRSGEDAAGGVIGRGVSVARAIPLDDLVREANASGAGAEDESPSDEIHGSIQLLCESRDGLRSGGCGGSWRHGASGRTQEYDLTTEPGVSDRPATGASGDTPRSPTMVSREPVARQPFSKKTRRLTGGKWRSTASPNQSEGTADREERAPSANEEERSSDVFSEEILVDTAMEADSHHVVDVDEDLPNTGSLHRTAVVEGQSLPSSTLPTPKYLQVLEKALSQPRPQVVMSRSRASGEPSLPTAASSSVLAKSTSPPFVLPWVKRSASTCHGLLRTIACGQEGMTPSPQQIAGTAVATEVATSPEIAQPAATSPAWRGGFPPLPSPPLAPSAATSPSAWASFSKANAQPPVAVKTSNPSQRVSPTSTTSASVKAAAATTGPATSVGSAAVGASFSKGGSSAVVPGFVVGHGHQNAVQAVGAAMAKVRGQAPASDDASGQLPVELSGPELLTKVIPLTTTASRQSDIAQAKAHATRLVRASHSDKATNPSRSRSQGDKDEVKEVVAADSEAESEEALENVTDGVATSDLGSMSDVAVSREATSPSTGEDVDAASEKHPAELVTANALASTGVSANSSVARTLTRANSEAAGVFLADPPMKAPPPGSSRSWPPAVSSAPAKAASSSAANAALTITVNALVAAAVESLVEATSAKAVSPPSSPPSQLVAAGVPTAPVTSLASPSEPGGGRGRQLLGDATHVAQPKSPTSLALKAMVLPAASTSAVPVAAASEMPKASDGTEGPTADCMGAFGDEFADDEESETEEGEFSCEYREPSPSPVTPYSFDEEGDGMPTHSEDEEAEPPFVGATGPVQACDGNFDFGVQEDAGSSGELPGSPTCSDVSSIPEGFELDPDLAVYGEPPTTPQESHPGHAGASPADEEEEEEEEGEEEELEIDKEEQLETKVNVFKPNFEIPEKRDQPTPPAIAFVEPPRDACMEETDSEESSSSQPTPIQRPPPPRVVGKASAPRASASQRTIAAMIALGGGARQRSGDDADTGTSDDEAGSRSSTDGEGREKEVRARAAAGAAAAAASRVADRPSKKRRKMVTLLPRSRLTAAAAASSKLATQVQADSKDLACSAPVVGPKIGQSSAAAAANVVAASRNPKLVKNQTITMTNRTREPCLAAESTSAVDASKTPLLQHADNDVDETDSEDESSVSAGNAASQTVETPLRALVTRHVAVSAKVPAAVLPASQTLAPSRPLIARKSSHPFPVGLQSLKPARSTSGSQVPSQASCSSAKSVMPPKQRSLDVKAGNRPQMDRLTVGSPITSVRSESLPRGSSSVGSAQTRSELVRKTSQPLKSSARGPQGAGVARKAQTKGRSQPTIAMGVRPDAMVGVEESGSTDADGGSSTSSDPEGRKGGAKASAAMRNVTNSSQSPVVPPPPPPPAEVVPLTPTQAAPTPTPTREASQTPTPSPTRRDMVAGAVEAGPGPADEESHRGEHNICGTEMTTPEDRIGRGDGVENESGSDGSSPSATAPKVRSKSSRTPGEVVYVKTLPSRVPVVQAETPPSAKLGSKVAGRIAASLADRFAEGDDDGVGDAEVCDGIVGPDTDIEDVHASPSSSSDEEPRLGEGVSTVSCQVQPPLGHESEQDKASTAPSEKMAPTKSAKENVQMHVLSQVTPLSELLRGSKQPLQPKTQPLQTTHVVAPLPLITKSPSDAEPSRQLERSGSAGYPSSVGTINSASVVTQGVAATGQSQQETDEVTTPIEGDEVAPPCIGSPSGKNGDAAAAAKLGAITVNETVLAVQKASTSDKGQAMASSEVALCVTAASPTQDGARNGHEAGVTIVDCEQVSDVVVKETVPEINNIPKEFMKARPARCPMPKGTEKITEAMRVRAAMFAADPEAAAKLMEKSPSQPIGAIGGTSGTTHRISSPRKRNDTGSTTSNKEQGRGRERGGSVGPSSTRRRLSSGRSDTVSRGDLWGRGRPRFRRSKSTYRGRRRRYGRSRSRSRSRARRSRRHVKSRGRSRRSTSSDRSRTRSRGRRRSRQDESDDDTSVSLQRRRKGRKHSRSQPTHPIGSRDACRQVATQRDILSSTVSKAERDSSACVSQNQNSIPALVTITKQMAASPLPTTDQGTEALTAAQSKTLLSTNNILPFKVEKDAPFSSETGDGFSDMSFGDGEDLPEPEPGPSPPTPTESAVAEAFASASDEKPISGVADVPGCGEAAVCDDSHAAQSGLVRSPPEEAKASLVGQSAAGVCSIVSSKSPQPLPEGEPSAKSGSAVLAVDGSNADASMRSLMALAVQANAAVVSEANAAAAVGVLTATAPPVLPFSSSNQPPPLPPPSPASTGIGPASLQSEDSCAALLKVLSGPAAAANPALMLIRHGVSMRNKAVVNSALAAADAGGLEIEAEIRTMLQQWLSDSLCDAPSIAPPSPPTPVEEAAPQLEEASLPKAEESQAGSSIVEVQLTQNELCLNSAVALDSLSMPSTTEGASHEQSGETPLRVSPSLSTRGLSSLDAASRSPPPEAHAPPSLLPQRMVSSVVAAAPVHPETPPTPHEMLAASSTPQATPRPPVKAAVSGIWPRPPASAPPSPAPPSTPPPAQTTKASPLSQRSQVQPDMPSAKTSSTAGLCQTNAPRTPPQAKLPTVPSQHPSTLIRSMPPQPSPPVPATVTMVSSKQQLLQSQPKSVVFPSSRARPQVAVQEIGVASEVVYDISDPAVEEVTICAEIVDAEPVPMLETQPEPSAEVCPRPPGCLDPCADSAVSAPSPRRPIPNSHVGTSSLGSAAAHQLCLGSTEPSQSVTPVGTIVEILPTVTQPVSPKATVALGKLASPRHGPTPPPSPSPTGTSTAEVLPHPLPLAPAVARSTGILPPPSSKTLPQKPPPAVAKIAAPLLQPPQPEQTLPVTQAQQAPSAAAPQVSTLEPSVALEPNEASAPITMATAAAAAETPMLPLQPRSSKSAASSIVLTTAATESPKMLLTPKSTSSGVPSVSAVVLEEPVRNVVGGAEITALSAESTTVANDVVEGATVVAKAALAAQPAAPDVSQVDVHAIAATAAAEAGFTIESGVASSVATSRQPLASSSPASATSSVVAITAGPSSQVAAATVTATAAVADKAVASVVSTSSPTETTTPSPTPAQTNAAQSPVAEVFDRLHASKPVLVQRQQPANETSSATPAIEPPRAREVAVNGSDGSGPPPITKELALVLDVDHTLVHASGIRDFGCPLNVKMYVNEQGDRELYEFDATGTEDQSRSCFVKLRPGVRELLRELSPLYEMCIFSMGDPDYVSFVVSLIDPTGSVFAPERVATRRDLEDGGKVLSKICCGLSPDRVVVFDDRDDVWKDELKRLEGKFALLRAYPYSFLSVKRAELRHFLTSGGPSPRDADKHLENATRVLREMYSLRTSTMHKFGTCHILNKLCHAVLRGLRLFVVEDDPPRWTKWVKAYGASVETELYAGMHAVVVSDALSHNANHPLVQRAKNFKVPLVHVDWLSLCFASFTLRDPAPFLLGVPNKTPQAGIWEVAAGNATSPGAPLLATAVRRSAKQVFHLLENCRRLRLQHNDSTSGGRPVLGGITDRATGTPSSGSSRRGLAETASKAARPDSSTAGGSSGSGSRSGDSSRRPASTRSAARHGSDPAVDPGSNTTSATSLASQSPVAPESGKPQDTTNVDRGAPEASLCWGGVARLEGKTDVGIIDLG